MNDVRAVTTRYSIQEHGLRKEDVDRVDRQNFASAQRLFLTPVQKCLEKILTGQGKFTIEYKPICLIHQTRDPIETTFD